MDQSPSWESSLLSASQEIPEFYKVQKFITFLKNSPLFIIRANLIQSMPSHPVSSKSTLILSYDLRLSLQSCLISSRFTT